MKKILLAEVAVLLALVLVAVFIRIGDSRKPDITLDSTQQTAAPNVTDPDPTIQSTEVFNPVTQPPTEPPTEPTEPSTVPTEPSVPPTTQPTVPPTTPTEPSEPVQPGEQEQNGGIQAWVLIVACIGFLLLGAVAGILVGKKLLKK